FSLPHEQHVASAAPLRARPRPPRLLAAPVAAQTFTACNPLNTTNCPVDIALGTNHTYDLTTSAAGDTWNTTAGTVNYRLAGAEFIMNSRGDAPTIQSNYYIFGGEVEFVDGASVRVLKHGNANGGKNFPQTLMQVKVGIWAGGDKDNDKDTIEWAGGETDYGKGPYTMWVKSVRVTDFSRGSEYSYGDMTGSWDSIKIKPGNSTIAEELNAPPPMTASQRWNKLPPGAKIGVGSAATESWKEGEGDRGSGVRERDKRIDDLSAEDGQGRVYDKFEGGLTASQDV
ncbi:MAG: hypothetical protein Q9172_006921, partial [Xanthocarpia lactea]